MGDNNKKTQICDVGFFLCVLDAGSDYHTKLSNLEKEVKLIISLDIKIFDISIQGHILSYKVGA